MTGEPGLKVERHRSPLHKEIKVNFKELLTAVGKAGINLALLKLDSLPENGLEVLTSLGLEAKPGEVAALLIIRAFKQAIKNLLDENQALLCQKPDNLQALYRQLDEALEQSELVVDQNFFQRPKDLPIVSTVKQEFAKWLEEFVEQKVEAENISCRLPAYFVFALNDQWQNQKADYEVLKEVLDTPFTQASAREQGWLRYRAWLQKRVEEPMFLEAFSLKQVYVPLRAYYEREVEAQTEQKLERSIRDEKKYERVVVNLNSELEAWLQEAKADDAIRLISGGPGSGKSSFAKMFAAQQAEKGEIPVLFIPLHLLSLSDDIVKAVGEFVQIDGFLVHNPMHQSDGESRLLIIFDGLDELSMQGKIAEETAKQFVEEVRLKVSQYNHRETRLQVLISGREVVVQANRSKFRKPHQILHLLPYFMTEEERQDENKNYVDEQKLLEEDQRQLWWQLYGKAKGKDYAGMPSELNQENLVEITAQPLLNYLVALSIERDKLQITTQTNLNEIYGDLLEAVYERGYEKHGYRLTDGIKKDEFVGILEEIGLACWHGDGRTTTVKEIEIHCDNSGLKDILARFQDSFNEDAKACVTRLLTAFYFRESGGRRESEKTFEFTHKSFGEYLAAKRIVQEVQRIHEELEERKKNFRKGWDERIALVSWAKVCGASAIDEYLFRFICDEIQLQKIEEVKSWQKTLCRLIEFMLDRGMPMESLNPRPSFQDEMRQARNAEEALLVVLNACARRTQQVSEIKWPAFDTFGAWIARIQGQRTLYEKNGIVLECLSFLDLQNCILVFRDFLEVNLEGVNLEGANLVGANLVEANLEGANLRWANLGRANLERANLERANLRWADLEGADLLWANLVGANLEEADLLWANLEGANLEGANLVGTILEGKDITCLTASFDIDLVVPDDLEES